MKRLLIVLFGVLVFQGSVWAESCLKAYPERESSHYSQSTIVHPALEGLVLKKNTPFLLQWKESDLLGSLVHIRLYKAAENGEYDRNSDLFKKRLNNKPNTGLFVITKNDFKKAQVRTDQKYLFQVEGTHPKHRDAILNSECFTFNVKQKDDLECHTATNMKDCVKVLVTQGKLLMEQVDELRRQLQGNDPSDGVAVINQNTGHEHQEYAAQSHGHNFDSSSHSHENYAEYIDRSAERHVSMTAATTSLESQVSALQAQVDALEGRVTTLTIGRDGDGEDSAWLTGGPDNECLHDAEGLWKPYSGMNATKCKGVKWNAANGNDPAINPVCWDTSKFRGAEWWERDDGINPWVVGKGSYVDAGAYDCLTKCAGKGGGSLNYCASEGWWNLEAANDTICTLVDSGDFGWRHILFWRGYTGVDELAGVGLDDGRRAYYYGIADAIYVIRHNHFYNVSFGACN